MNERVAISPATEAYSETELNLNHTLAVTYEHNARGRMFDSVAGLCDAWTGWVGDMREVSKQILTTALAHATKELNKG